MNGHLLALIIEGGIIVGSFGVSFAGACIFSYMERKNPEREGAAEFFEDWAVFSVTGLPLLVAFSAIIVHIGICIKSNEKQEEEYKAKYKDSHYVSADTVVAQGNTIVYGRSVITAETNCYDFDGRSVLLHSSRSTAFGEERNESKGGYINIDSKLHRSLSIQRGDTIVIYKNKYNFAADAKNKSIANYRARGRM
jgi:hypothetical protein